MFTEPLPRNEVSSDSNTQAFDHNVTILKIALGVIFLHSEIFIEHEIVQTPE
jgi:hypothetical protein